MLSLVSQKRLPSEVVILLFIEALHAIWWWWWQIQLGDVAPHFPHEEVLALVAILYLCMKFYNNYLHTENS